jgi:hypothetical protein
MGFRSGRPQACRSKSERDGLGDLVLNLEHVAERTLEPVRPLVIAVGYVHQLDCNAQPITCLAHATLHHR